jgi:hypothetical protein
VPLALYVDWKNLYKRRATPKERLRGEEQITQFERMCAKLGIELTAANSPQAKGRVRKNPRDASRSAGEEIAAKRNHESRASERVPGASICWNTMGFVRPPAKPGDYHRRTPRAATLDRVFRLESPRTIYNDWVVRYDNRFFQLQRQTRHYAPAHSQVVVCEGRYGNITIEYRGRELAWREIPAQAKPFVPAVQAARRAAEQKARERQWPSGRRGGHGAAVAHGEVRKRKMLWVDRVGNRRS